MCIILLSEEGIHHPFPWVWAGVSDLLREQYMKRNDSNFIVKKLKNTIVTKDQEASLALSHVHIMYLW